MEKDSVSALEEISRRLHQGCFTSQFDAMCLASVEIDELSPGETQEVKLSSARDEVKTPPGWKGMTSEILGVLNSAYIYDQGALGSLQRKIDYFMEENCDSSSCGGEEKGFNVTEDMNNCEPIMHTNVKNDKAETSRTASTLAPSAMVLQSRRVAHRKLQQFYNDVFDIIASKTRAQERIDAIVSDYVEIISRLASTKGIKHATQRTEFIAQPVLEELLNHRYLDSCQAKTMLRSLQAFAASSYMRDRDDFAKCRLAIDYQASQRDKFGIDINSLKSGAVVVLLLWAVSECFNNEKAGGQGAGDIWKDPTFAIFVCLGDLTLLLWLWGVSLSVWRHAGIDYLDLLSLHRTDLAGLCRICPEGDFTSSAAERIVFSCATDISLIYLIAFVMFNKILRGSFFFSGEPSPAFAHTIPSCLLAFYFWRFFYPFASSRKVWLRMLWKVLAAPYYTVKFRDGYIGDLLTSLVRVSINLSFSVIYVVVEVISWLSNDLEAVENVQTAPWWQRSYIYRFQLVPFLTLLPLWLRFMQCLRRSLETGKRWPHSYNALKYACALMVFSFGVLHPNLQQNSLWILCLCVATCYQFFWDITMDWGLVQVEYTKEKSGGRLFFRSELLFGAPWVYYAIIAGNFLLRFAWAITYVPREIHRFSPVYSYVYNNFQTVMAAMEIVRRMIWGFLRLEWEYMEKTGTTPLSLHQQQSLDWDAGMVSEKRGSMTNSEKGFDLSLGFDGGIEMHKMNIESGYGHNERISDLCVGDIYTQIPCPESKMSTRSTDDYTNIAEKNGFKVLNNDVDDDDDDNEGELYWILSLLPFDISAGFPYFLFHGLEKSVAAYSRRRFQARIVEVTIVASFVLCIMSVSALTKMHSAGYI